MTTARLLGSPAIALAFSATALHAQDVIELPGRDRPIEPDFEEVYRVGVLDGESWEMFGRIRRVAFDAEGNLYVFDASDAMGSDLRVLVFDAAGGFTREFGSSGQGPGEFNRPAGFAVLRDGTVVVSDAGHGAYQMFDRSGVFQRMVRAGDEPGSTPGLSGNVQPDPRGGAVFVGGFGGGPGISFRTGGADSGIAPPTSRPVVRIGLGDDGVQADTVVHGWLPPRSELDLPTDVPAQLRDMMGGMSLRTRFEPRLLVGTLPDGGIVHSDSSAYALKVTPPGATEVARVIQRPLLPEPLTAEDQREYEERTAAAREEAGQAAGRAGLRMVQFQQRGEGSNPTPTATFRIEQRYYHEIPVLRGLAVTWDSRIWVQRRGELPESDGPIDVLTAGGEYVGTYAMDATQVPDAFGPDGLAAFIELDDFDVARVVVRRLPAEVR
ncbi:MAG: 6-bladed beta-propeller [Gemmatimonadota bacterium]|nr:6-bladed beta-propeller [Gemmatimonadota bacterium]